MMSPPGQKPRCSPPDAATHVACAQKICRGGGGQAIYECSSPKGGEELDRRSTPLPDSFRPLFFDGPATFGFLEAGIDFWRSRGQEANPKMKNKREAILKSDCKNILGDFSVFHRPHHHVRRTKGCPPPPSATPLPARTAPPPARQHPDGVSPWFGAAWRGLGPGWTRVGEFGDPG